ncbi:ABC transporter ATP-binding protein [Parvibacter caecicola]|uniref:ABC transporter ATP-binding protein n=1 Tax=Parvibacter caecicola TaxID=747645 RepID=UPI00249C18DF|nr:ABC transporter ATP-binding protein [Parvibacter caecicola]
MALIDVERVSFRYPDREKPALREVSLSVERGGYMVLCGPSGCGKTTLLRLMKTVLAPHGQLSGRILLDGTPLEDVPLRQQAARIGFVMQNPDAQIVTDKVWHELAFGLENLGTPQPVMRARVAEMASYFGIQHWFDKDVAELSGGQKQLLNLASVMAMAPDVLLLDEPTSQLDPIAASDFLATVARLNRELGTTVVMAEQRLEEVLAAADTAVVLEEGAITAAGHPRTVAARLLRDQSPIRAAMPTAAQVAFAVEGEGILGNGREMPLTVREGRQWLEERIQAHPPATRALPAPESPAAAAPPALQVRDLWFRYQRTQPDVLRGTALTVPSGSLFALVGGNGTGKSTLLKAVCGIVKPQRGAVGVLGRPLKNWKPAHLFRGAVACLPQDPLSLMAHDTVEACLQEVLTGIEGARLRAAAGRQAPSMPGEARPSAADELQRVVGFCQLEDLLAAHPADLSGGQLQRAALAMVLLCWPQLLLLDEPTKGMDAAFKQQLGQLLQRLTRQGATVLMVSHDVEFCAQWATQVALMFNGEVVAQGSPREFFSGNSFYTTAASRMSRGLFQNAVTAQDVAALCG